MIDPQVFLNSENPIISSTCVELLSQKYLLSENWNVMHKIYVPEEGSLLKDSVEKAVLYLKKKKVMGMLEENRKKILYSQSNNEDCTSLLIEHQRLEQLKVEISKNALGIDILR